MYIPNDSINDTNMRYRHCLVHINNKLVYITSIRRCTTDRIELEGKEWAGYGFIGEEKIYDVKPDEIDYSKVEPQYVNFIPSKGCGLIRRHSRRSVYSLGTRDDNTVVKVLGPRFNVDVLPYAVSRVGSSYPNLHKAFSLMQKGLTPARALSKRVAISRENDQTYVYILSKPVGILLDEDLVELPYKHKFFKEELEEIGYNVALKEEPNEKDI